MVWKLERVFGEGDREEFIAMVKIYATERQFPRSFKLFYFLLSLSCMRRCRGKKKKLPSPPPPPPSPRSLTHPPYSTPPTELHQQKGGRKLSSVGKWKWNFFFHIISVLVLVTMNWILSFLLYEKQKKKKKKEKFQGKTNEINYGYWIVWLEVSFGFFRGSHKKGKQKFPWICL